MMTYKEFSRMDFNSRMRSALYSCAFKLKDDHNRFSHQVEHD